MTNIYQKQVNNWRDDIAKILYHPSLVKHTGVPKLNDLQMTSLFLPLLLGENEKELTSYYATAIIYIALSRHDDVIERGTLNKSQQLQVLAGDYYSGKYYQLLSVEGKTELIGQLTNSIRLMTEARTQLLCVDKTSEVQRLTASQTIVTAPTQALFQQLGLTKYVPLAKTIAFCQLPQMDVSDLLGQLEAYEQLPSDLKMYIRSLLHEQVELETKL
ncbi:heptaprenyl diphosphate synthase component 1 [Chryseomicrobium palamuruense]